MLALLTHWRMARPAAGYLPIGRPSRRRRRRRRRISALAEFFVAAVNPPRNICAAADEF